MTMAFSTFHLVCVLVSVSVYHVKAIDESSIRKTIEDINSVQSKWKAEYNPVLEVGFVKPRVTVNFKELKKLETWPSIKSSDEIPKDFDLRNEKPACKDLVSLIRDRGGCGSDWALVPASVFSDRLCIASNGTFNQPLSAGDLVRCCDKCKLSSGNGCEGGNLLEPFNHMRDVGIVSGGEYSSGQGCLPYSFAPGVNATKAEPCSKQCTNPSYKKSYNEDKHQTKKVYISSYDPTKIKNYLMTNGSLGALMQMYEDFKYYKSGIYERVKGKFLGFHVVRLIGWGVENGVEYWLAANSWGASWGIQGTFKINRRSRCGFGTYVFGVEV